MMNRRTFVAQSTTVAVGLGLARPALAWGHRVERDYVYDRDVASLSDKDLVRTIALRAVDAARTAGATYADVRVTRWLQENWLSPTVMSEYLAIGVRALANGCWGFASSPYWDADEAVRLARDAVEQARGNAKATPRVVEWTPIPAASGHWNTPIEVDPFTIPIEEKFDLVGGWGIVGAHVRNSGLFNRGLFFDRQERAVATTEGAYFTQTLYKCGVTEGFGHRFDSPGFYTPRGQTPTLDLDTHQLIGGGWEVIRDSKVVEQIPGAIETLRTQTQLPVNAGTFGRYDVVIDTATMASLVAMTLGTATELDRAMGYEANAGGTSFLTAPLDMIGNYQIGSPLLTLTANRSSPQGLATVKWDDEGVEPDDFTLVKDGVVVDFLTTREQASWLAATYRRRGQAVRSHGCAAADDAMHVSLTHLPNLVMAPGRAGLTFDNLVANVKNGIAIVAGGVSDLDFQARNGMVSGVLWEIRDGRLVARLSGLVMLFNTMELWKNLIALGGEATQGIYAATSTKGEPAQTTSCAVTAVPALFKNMAFVDPFRRA